MRALPRHMACKLQPRKVISRIHFTVLCSHVMDQGGTDLVLIRVILVAGSWRLQAGSPREGWEICAGLGVHGGTLCGGLR